MTSHEQQSIHFFGTFHLFLIVPDRQAVYDASRKADRPGRSHDDKVNERDHEGPRFDGDGRAGIIGLRIQAGIRCMNPFDMKLRVQDRTERGTGRSREAAHA